MLIKVRNYLAPNFATGDFRIRVRGPPATYDYGSHMTLVTRGSIAYSSHQKGVIQGHLVHRYASRRAPALCSMIMFGTVLSLDVSTQTIFLYYVRKIFLEGGGISDVLWCPCYALVIMSNRWNQYGFSILHRLYTWGHRWILALLLTFVDWYKHSNTNFAGSKCILNRIWCIIWRPKAVFFIKMSTLYNGLHNKFGLYVFPSFIDLEFGIYRLFTVPYHLKCIHAVFAMLWPFQKMLVPRCSTDWSVANLFLVSVYINNLNDSRHYFVTGPSSLFCMGVCVIILSNVFPVHSLHKRFLILILILTHRGYEIKHTRMYVIFVNFHDASIINLGKHGTHLAFSYTGRFALFLRIHCERIPLLFLHTIYWLTANHTLLVKRVVIFLNFRR